jgi:alginate O-acetyltransferase complex protein AlgI
LLFSSPLFLFCFLPIVLAGYAAASVLGRRAQNALLLVSSVLFYAWGEGVYTLVMLASMLMNFAFGRLVDRVRGQQRAEQLAVTMAVTANLCLIAYFKYKHFLLDAVNAVLVRLGSGALANDPVHLPIGISFFTFHALSYVIDVRRGEAPVQKSPARLLLYLSLFPQLVAGPIIRYGDIQSELTDRRASLSDIEYGCLRFVAGLAKKVLLANTCAEFADYAFALPDPHLTAGIAWLGVLAYTLQIYFDFSGYSDMAIGLARLFGFHFKENFAHPYASRSVREFWRRWHISLSSFFRDYLYVPLGGNRGGPMRTHLNLAIVFVLCGLWHGASWTFVGWGAYHGLFLVLERTAFGRAVERLPRALESAYTLLVVMVGWVLFRAESVEVMVRMLKGMLGLHAATPDVWFVVRMTRELVFALLLGAVLSFPVAQRLGRFVAELSAPLARGATRWGLALGTLALLVLSAARLASGTYNPFIYFKF